MIAGAPARHFLLTNRRRLLAEKPRMPKGDRPAGSSTPRRRRVWWAQAGELRRRQGWHHRATLSAARALGRYGVCANVICPRARTAMAKPMSSGAAPDVEAGQTDPLSPQHVVSLVQFLASPAAAEVNSQVSTVRR